MNLYRRFSGMLTFKRKLLAVIVVLSIAPIPLFGLFSYYTVSRSVEEEVDLNHQMILAQIENHVDTFLQSLGKSSLEIASNPSVETSVRHGISIERYLAESTEMMDTLQKYRSLSDIAFDVSVVYHQFGKVYSNLYGYIDLEQFPYREIVRNSPLKYNGFVVVSPGTYPEQNEILVVRPIPATSLPGIGTLLLHVNPDNLTVFLKELNIGQKILFILDEKGKVVAASNATAAEYDLASSVRLYEFWKQSPNRPSQISFNHKQYDLSAQRSAFTSWTYVIMTPTAELNRKLNHIQQATFGMVVLLSAIWVVLAVAGSNRLYVPIQRLLSIFGAGTSARSDAIQTLDQQLRHMMAANKQLKVQLGEQLPYWREGVFLRLLRGEMSDQEFRRQTEHYGFPLEGQWMCVCMVEVDRLDEFQRVYSKKDRSLIAYALSKLIEEISGDRFSSITVIPRSGQYALMLGIDRWNDDTESAVRAVCDEIRVKVAQYFPFTVSVSMSGGKQQYGGLIDGYQEAQMLMGYRLLLGTDVTIARSDIPTSVRSSGRPLIETSKTIVHSIAQGDFPEAERQLGELMRLVPTSVANKETALAMFAYLIGELDGFIHELGYEPEQFFEADLYQSLYGFSSLEDVERWLKDTVFRSIREKLSTLQIGKQKRLLQQVLAYIHERYDQDLSLQGAADFFGVSTGQIGRAFKDELDTNFSHYLIEYRIGKAKEWLVHTDMPIKEMTERLRYTTVHNFTRIFTKTVGMPPATYRKTYRQDGMMS
ncbi:helix-turn-helix domain-containing protein [Paenibacillus ginsengarvi]|uniref:Helix-turn-helix domain-containing protein n=1 Tax=Paenibacillus ginsengarvi TaxID=400777 RepID=A0A3B0CKP7_9BACL|nr:helix-turn-helix domain-containing protein [Paenibacillus ginsengarvi]RKN85550.1 helix-turn-helix domain-containing protein [Paenibacillus ginsengarvi]